MKVNISLVLGLQLPLLSFLRKCRPFFGGLKNPQKSLDKVIYHRFSVPEILFYRDFCRLNLPSGVNRYKHKKNGFPKTLKFIFELNFKVFYAGVFEKIDFELQFQNCLNLKISKRWRTTYTAKHMSNMENSSWVV